MPLRKQDGSDKHETCEPEMLSPHTGSNSEIFVTVCFQKGGRWSVCSADMFFIFSYDVSNLCKPFCGSFDYTNMFCRLNVCFVRSHQASVWQCVQPQWEAVELLCRFLTRVWRELRAASVHQHTAAASSFNNGANYYLTHESLQTVTSKFSPQLSDRRPITITIWTHLINVWHFEVTCVFRSRRVTAKI